MYWNEQNQSIIGAVHFTLKCEGAAGKSYMMFNVDVILLLKGMVHGGAIATVIDSWLGYLALKADGLGYVTITLTINYKKFVKLDIPVMLETKIDKQEGKKKYMSAVMSDGEGNILCEATAIFYRQDYICYI
jgi:acyl-coenzyme A thioesterase PaaI-like protein